MITIFNRRELLTTFSLAKQAAIRELLSDNDIDYYIKTVNLDSASLMGISVRQWVLLAKILIYLMNILFMYVTQITNTHVLC